jgi:Periplasmic protein TonB, links inner and outer membranes
MKKVVGQRLLVCFLLALAFCVLPATAQRKAAIITPEKNPTASAVAEKLEENFAAHFKILDRTLAETVFQSRNLETPFNLSTDEARNLGKALGADFYILLKSETIARTSLEKGTYRESYAALFTVSARSGKLIFWKLVKAEEYEAKEAERKLFSSLDALSAEAAAAIRDELNKELNEPETAKIAEPPDENSPESKTFRPPLPFRRIKPEYTLLANLYSVTATIDIAVDIDADGKILRTEIRRWAGYGLDESVAETVRRMNWRAAEQNGKSLPMRVLLRYNFKKIEDE